VRPMAGLPKSIIKKYGISKKAWSVYRSGRSGNRKANKPRKRHMSIVRRMPRRRTTYRKAYRRARNSFLNFNTLTKFIKIGALAAPAIDTYQKGGGGLQGATNAMALYAGWNVQGGFFDWGLLAKAWTPYVATSLVTVGISKLNGIIRRL